MVQTTTSFPIDLTKMPFSNKLLDLNLSDAMEMSFTFWTEYKGDDNAGIFPKEFQIQVKNVYSFNL